MEAIMQAAVGPGDVVEVSRCRVCQQNDLARMYSLGDLAVSDFVSSQGEVGLKAPLDMVRCRSCSLVQLRHTAPQELLYARKYWYRSGVTETMRKVLAGLASFVQRASDLRHGDVVLDIGSNDGTFLRALPSTVRRVGFEPATNLAEEGAAGIDTFIGEFWSAEKYLAQVGTKAKAVTAFGMFYDLDDPVRFIADVAAVLRRDGLFFAQLMCLKDMYDQADVGNICHEHLTYFSLEALERMFQLGGLELIDVRHNDVNGGSYLVVAKPIGGSAYYGAQAKTRVAEAKHAERFLNTPQAHQEFFWRIKANKKATTSFIDDALRAAGKSVWVYGASTKGNTILQWYALRHTEISGAADRSPEKWGKFTVGSGIPIKSEEDSRAANPDYFFVLPYGFLSEFRARERDWLEAGGRFIVCTPSFRVIDANSPG